MKSLWAGRSVPVPVQVTAMTIGAAGLQGFTALLMAKWLGASDRGVIAIAQTISMVLVLVGTGGLTTASRFLLSDPSRQIGLRTYVVATRWLMVTQVLVTATIGVTTFLKLTSETFGWTSVLFVLLSFGSMRAALLREALHGVGWHRQALFSELFASGLPLLLMYASFLNHSLRLDIAFASLALGSLAQVCSQMLFNRRYFRSHVSSRVRTKRSWTLLREMLRFSLPTFVASIAFVFVGRMDRLILAYFYDSSAVGVYATASTLADVSWVIPIASSAIIVRQVATAGSAQLHRFWYVRVMTAAIALSAIVFGASILLFNWFFDESFRGGVPVTGILLIGSVALASQQVDLAVCTGLGDLRATSSTALIGLGVAAPLFFALIPALGGIGCSIASTLTYIVFAVVARVRLRRHTNRTVLVG